jgi:uncharacterized membrane protein
LRKRPSGKKPVFKILYYFVLGVFYGLNVDPLIKSVALIAIFVLILIFNIAVLYKSKSEGDFYIDWRNAYIDKDA